MPELTDPPPRPAPILSRYAAVLLCGIWLLTGVIGHEPWKPEDALHLGVAFGMSGGDWLVPRIAGDPWLVSPPLYHWVAALCGKLLGWLLPWHDAARLASTLFAAAFLAVLWRIAQRQMAPSPALAAPLLAIGTLGLLVPLHEAPAGHRRTDRFCRFALGPAGLARRAAARRGDVRRRNRHRFSRHGGR